MVSSLLITGKDKIKTDDFNFALGKSERWSINLELLDENHKEELLNEDLAESINAWIMVRYKKDRISEDVYNKIIDHY